MTIDEILAKLTVINTKLHAKYANLDNTTYILARSAKVSEEYGEFVDELLSSLHMQRDDKLDKYDPDNLACEFADVYITLMLLGMSAGIDVESAIEKRLNEQYKKWSSS